MGEVNIFTGGDAVLRWAIRQLDDPDVTSIEQLKPGVCFGIALDKRPIGACVFTEFRPGAFGNDMRIMLVSTDPRWCTRHVLRTLADYAFKTADCARVTSIIREGNTAAVDMNLRLGFRKEGTIRRGWNGKTNALVFGILKTECRWYSDKEITTDGQGLQRAASGS